MPLLVPYELPFYHSGIMPTCHNISTVASTAVEGPVTIIPPVALTRLVYRYRLPTSSLLHHNRLTVFYLQSSYFLFFFQC
jgi:hypothetical protein